MSRVGKNPITIPEGVSVEVSDNKIIVKGKLGQIEQEFSDVSININEGVLTLERPSEAKDHKSKHGLYRALINNMVIGVSEGWTKELELVGVGYRATAQGQKLELALGFSHSIVMSLANEIKVETVCNRPPHQGRLTFCLNLFSYSVFQYIGFYAKKQSDSK